MKLYYFPLAPNPTKVLIYLKEKGIDDIELVKVNLLEGQQRSAEHLARNPEGNLPVLELDSGEYLVESMAIIEYLEELYPAVPMIGEDPLARARVRSLERKVEKQLLESIGRYVHTTKSPIGLPPIPAIAEIEEKRIPAAMVKLDQIIGDRVFAAGDSPSIVDCTLYAALLFGQFFAVEIPPDCANLKRWYASFAQRPSAQISL